MQDLIPVELYREILANIPVPCVDVAVRHPQTSHYLLVKRANDPLKGMFWPPGGRVLRNEPLHNAAVRKVREETGLQVQILGILGIYQDVFKDNEFNLNFIHTISTVFLAEPIQGTVVLDSQSTEFLWAESLPERLKIIKDFYREKQAEF
jgi:colanic acid biosynthesis protein WcaH